MQLNGKQPRIDEKVKILIVDDDKNTCKILTLIFEKMGYEAESVGTGKAALTKVQENFYNVILLDIRLPDIEGIELISPLKKAEPVTLIMMITAFASQETAINAMNRGASAYITKPFHMEEVLNKVKDAVEKQHLEFERDRLNKQLQEELVERRKIEKRLERTNIILDAVRNVNRLITKEKNQQKLIDGACRTLVESRGFFWAWIVLIDEFENFLTASECGLGSDFAHMLDHLKLNELPLCCSKSLQSRGVLIFDDCQSSCSDCPLRSRGMKLMANRLEYDQKVYGVLCASLSPTFISEEEQSIFQEVADDIAFALHDIAAVEAHRRIETALRLNEEKLRRITETSPDYIMMLDSECRIEFINRADQGIKLEELIGTPLYNFVDEGERSRVKQILMDVINHKKSMNYETNYKRPDGTIVHFESLAAPMESEETVIGIIVNSRDVTERKRAEIALKESEQRYALAQKSAKLGSWDWNIRTGNLEWSEKVEVLFGYSNGEFNRTYEGFLETVHPEDKQFVSNSVNTSVEEGKDYDIEHRIVWPDGTVRWVSEKGDMLRDESGKVFRMLGIVQDITKRKNAELALAEARDTLAQKVEVATRDLREEKQRIETVVETIPDGIAVIDREGKIYLVNRVFKDYYQRIYDSGFPSSLKELSLLENPFGDTISKLYYSKTHETLTIEPIKGLHLQLASSRLIISPDMHLGVVISVRDVTPFVELDNLRKQFISVVSHELRTPITAINLSLRNLQKFRKKISEEQLDEIINMTTDSAHVLTQMIEDLLVASRVEVGKIKLEWAPYQLSNIIQGVLNVLEPRVVAKSIALKVDADTKISLYGDEKRISQILRILVDNAIKYSEKNSIVIIKAKDNYHGEFNPKAQGGTLLQVIDSGRGIPKEDLPQIFDSFFRSKDVSDKRGSGLGLSIAQELISLHHGEIFVDSIHGEGSTFSVFLPRIENLEKFSIERQIEVGGNL